ncbi:MAG: hypothetical protein ACK5OC_15265 [Pirellula sp.]
MACSKLVQLRNHSLELLRNRSLVLELEHSKVLVLVLVLLHSKELVLVLVLRSMVLELVRSSLTLANEASKAIP